MKRVANFLAAIVLFLIATDAVASVFTPINLMFDITKSNAAFAALMALFFIEVVWLRFIADTHILKVLLVIPLMNLASVAITFWGPYFIFENIITGKFTRYMVYVNFKDFMASNTAFLHGLLIVGIWVLINVAVEAMVVGLFYHTINKRSLITMLITVHLLSVGVAVAPELMKKLDIKEIKLDRSKQRASAPAKEDGKKARDEGKKSDAATKEDKKTAQ